MVAGDRVEIRLTMLCPQRQAPVNLEIASFAPEKKQASSTQASLAS